MIAYGLSAKGPVRTENQDRILIITSGTSGLFLVADGVGGAENGAIASSRIVQEYKCWWEKCFLPKTGQGFTVFFDQLKQLAGQLSQDLYNLYGPKKSCSTLVLLFLHQGVWGYLSVGDSRLYGLENGTARLLTRDDVWENKPSGSTLLLEHAGKILSAVGGYEQLEYSCATDELKGYQGFLLCSDGIYKFVPPAQLERLACQGVAARLLPGQRVKKAVGQLEQLALKAHTNDNYSAILVRVSARDTDR